METFLSSLGSIGLFHDTLLHLMIYCKGEEKVKETSEITHFTCQILVEPGQKAFYWNDSLDNLSKFLKYKLCYK